MAGAGIPTIKDIPDDLELIYVETPRPDGPFGASGTGEIPLCGPHPAIINAIYNACGARVTHLPAYPERCWRPCPRSKWNNDCPGPVRRSPVRCRQG